MATPRRPLVHWSTGLPQRIFRVSYVRAAKHMAYVRSTATKRLERGLYPNASVYQSEPHNKAYVSVSHTLSIPVVFSQSLIYLPWYRLCPVFAKHYSAAYNSPLIYHILERFAPLFLQQESLGGHTPSHTTPCQGQDLRHSVFATLLKQTSTSTLLSALSHPPNPSKLSLSPSNFLPVVVPIKGHAISSNIYKKERTGVLCSGIHATRVLHRNAEKHRSENASVQKMRQYTGTQSVETEN